MMYACQRQWEDAYNNVLKMGKVVKRYGNDFSHDYEAPIPQSQTAPAKGDASSDDFAALKIEMSGIDLDNRMLYHVEIRRGTQYGYRFCRLCIHRDNRNSTCY